MAQATSVASGQVRRNTAPAAPAHIRKIQLTLTVALTLTDTVTVFLHNRLRTYSILWGTHEV